MADWEQELRESAVSYNGEEVSKAKDITLEQIVPALPPQGVVGSPAQTQSMSAPGMSPDVAEMLYNPTDLIISDAKRECTWHERMMLSGIASAEGKSVFNGAFGVLKSGGKTVVKDNLTLPVLRLIMNLVPFNACHSPLRLVGSWR
eukprot:2713716-Amphidinium_carterae.1